MEFLKKNTNYSFNIVYTIKTCSHFSHSLAIKKYDEIKKENEILAIKITEQSNKINNLEEDKNKMSNQINNLEEDNNKQANQIINLKKEIEFLNEQVKEINKQNQINNK